MLKHITNRKVLPIKPLNYHLIERPCQPEVHEWVIGLLNFTQRALPVSLADVSQPKFTRNKLTGFYEYMLINSECH